MKKHIAAVAAAAGLSISGIVASAGPVQAAVPCSITGFTPSTVIVGLSPVERIFNVTQTCPPAGWFLQLDTPISEAPARWSWDSDLFDRETFTDKPGRFSTPLVNADAGSHSAYAAAFAEPDISMQRSWASGFHLKRQGSWLAGARFNAGPEPVKKGRAITLSGTLSRANWDTHKYQGHGFKPVEVQFRTPTGLYATVKTVNSAANGSVKTTVTAQRTGYWRLVYRGNATSGPIKAAGDRVDVN